MFCRNGGVLWQQHFLFIDHFHKDHEQKKKLFYLTDHFCHKCGIKDLT